ncbi:MAG: hypothetical protein AAGB05_18205 [Pseudomonadota bacterium]
MRDVPLWQDRTRARHRVAQTLVGAACDVRRLRALEGGANNRGIALYEAVARDDGRRTHRFVEKITPDRTEFQVASLLAKTAGSPVMPRVLATSTNPGGYVVFMEWWPEAADTGASQAADRPDPVHLARAVHRLPLDFAALAGNPDFPRSAPYFERLAARFRSYLRKTAGIGEARLAHALSTVAAMPRSITHDDLNFSNIVPRPVAPGIGVGLIDVGSIRLNAAGSSFQRLALLDVVEGEGAPLREATAEYARLSDSAAHNLRFAAYLYAASRRLNRNVNKLEPDPFETPARLLEHALREL